MLRIPADQTAYYIQLQYCGRVGNLDDKTRKEKTVHTIWNDLSLLLVLNLVLVLVELLVLVVLVLVIIRIL